MSNFCIIRLNVRMDLDEMFRLYSKAKILFTFHVNWFLAHCQKVPYPLMSFLKCVEYFYKSYFTYLFLNGRWQKHAVADGQFFGFIFHSRTLGIDLLRSTGKLFQQAFYSFVFFRQNLVNNFVTSSSSKSSGICLKQKLKIKIQT